jgi:hypothetical protein
MMFSAPAAVKHALYPVLLAGRKAKIRFYPFRASSGVKQESDEGGTKRKPETTYGKEQFL